MKRKLLTVEDVLELIRQDVKACGTQQAFASKVGITQGYVNDILKRKREPGPKILDALGLRKVVTYEAKE
jgi:hypothetical protein